MKATALTTMALGQPHLTLEAARQSLRRLGLHISRSAIDFVTQFFIA